METPEGKTLSDFFKENKVLNLDIDMLVSRGTLLFLQFNNLMNRISDIESKLVKNQKLLENNARLLRDIKRSIADVSAVSCLP